MVAAYLARLGNPRTVFDVGVGFGSYELYKAFPSARFVLVEPIEDFEPTIQDIKAKYDCVVCRKAASDFVGSSLIRVDPQALELTSFAKRTALASTGQPIEMREIKVTTIDSIVSQCPDLEAPFFLKVDTEGHELAALRGAKRTLERTETVLVKASIAPQFEDGYRFEDMIILMRERDFELTAIINISHASGEVRARFADLAFQRRSH